MDSRYLKPALAGLAIFIVGALIGYALRAVPAPSAPDPKAIADASLLSVRDGGRLISYTARFASVVTASETQLGLTARKTLIMPGTIRYGLDLSRLRRSNLEWDDGSRTLTVTLPPLELSQPMVNPEEVQEYKEGGVLLALTDAEEALDQDNLRNAQADLLRQARAEPTMQLAQNAAMRMVARSFAMPLRSAGIDASVAVRLLDSAGKEKAAFLDRAQSIEDALRDRRAGRKKP